MEKKPKVTTRKTALDKILSELGMISVGTVDHQLRSVLNEIRRLRNIQRAWDHAFANFNEFLGMRQAPTIREATQQVISVGKEARQLAKFRNGVRRILNDTGHADDEKILEMLRELKQKADKAKLVAEASAQLEDDDPSDLGVQVRSALGLFPNADDARVIRSLRFKVDQLYKFRVFLQGLAKQLNVDPDINAIRKAVISFKNREALRGRFFSRIKDELLVGYGVETEEDALKHLTNWKEALVEIEERELAETLPPGTAVRSSNHVHPTPANTTGVDLLAAAITGHARLVHLAVRVSKMLARTGCHSYDARNLEALAREWEREGIYGPKK